MKLILIILVGLVVGLMVACRGDYPTAVTENWVQTCVFKSTSVGLSEKDATQYCDCTMKELEQEYSVIEFFHIDKQITEGKPNAVPAKMEEIFEACASTIQ